MQISKFLKNRHVKSVTTQSGRKYKKCAREDVYTDKQLRPVLFKATIKQSLPLTISQIIQIW